MELNSRTSLAQVVSLSGNTQWLPLKVLLRGLEGKGSIRLSRRQTENFSKNKCYFRNICQTCHYTTGFKPLWTGLVCFLRKADIIFKQVCNDESRTKHFKYLTILFQVCYQHTNSKDQHTVYTVYRERPVQSAFPSFCCTSCKRIIYFSGGKKNKSLPPHTYTTTGKDESAVHCIGNQHFWS